MTKTLALGIDIGGTNTAYGIVTQNGEILHHGSIATKGHVSIDAFIDELYYAISDKKSSSLFEQIKGIGVGAPNGNYYTGNIEFAPNLEWKGIIPLAKLFEHKFSIPTIITNDANAAAMGEMKYGAAIGMKDFIMVTLGTGVGSGFVVNGQVLYGHDGAAGELGHVITIQDGRACGCGRKGCLETYTSATGIVKTAIEFLSSTTTTSLLRRYSNIEAKHIYEAAVHGDELAMAIFEYTGKILGFTLANTVAITSPEAIILFGGLAKAGEFIFKPTHFYMEENMLSIYKNKVKLLPSLLYEGNAAILGAAALVV